MREIFIVLCFFLFFSESLVAEDKPNIIFILTDDQRYDMLGCTGNKLIQTPNIDKLAKEGTLFSNAHVTSAICTPSRTSILLSQFERKHGVNFNSGTSVAPEAWEKSYPVILRQNGYYTGYIGKNHTPVGNEGYESGLMEKSFDYWYAGHKHLTFYPKTRHEIFKGAKSDTQVEIIGEGIQDFLGNEHQIKEARYFLENRPNNKPFFLNICFNLPHGAGTGSMKLLESDPEIYRTLYRDLNIPLPENYIAKSDIKTHKLPESVHHFKDRQTGYNWVDAPNTVRERVIRQMQTVTGIDRLIGELRETLKANGLEKNTVIIFTSDHGLFSGEFGLGGKALCYEICTHVPFIIYNPLVKESAGGQIVDELIQTIDIAPTLLAYAGIEIPDSYQGKTLNHIIEGEITPVREYLFTENLWSTPFGNPRCDAVQNKEWKYIRYNANNNISAIEIIKMAKDMGMRSDDLLYGVHDTEIAIYRNYVEAPFHGEEPIYEELFNLKNDPNETTNIAAEANYSQILKEMRRIWKLKIAFARGKDKPQVVRYTKDSQSQLVKAE
ncbi:sulfatase-like hydrolase/transferase [Maribellus comscasis]|uniref:Sulfatase-like hydrolase/transferase n=1 Tax=Maribellus comscasis TaxID=2681766 RepID=A0A6I6K4F0_9BACT|nr:sulfatase-like hydrolase/transferase [Maribellus comscasis]QGY47507.1 sulfatase-like hydrolase/transferase [Maribellus comscasis]